MRRFRIELGVLVLVLSAGASTARAADRDAVISGVVRDARGVPQMGAVIQVLSADAVVCATAFTDLQGHYSVAKLSPGSYGVRASAALFLPALRSNLRLERGRRSVVNLTLSALFDEPAWLPARAKGRDETADDWNWTLRSTAGRPILKLAADEDVAEQTGAEQAGTEQAGTEQAGTEQAGTEASRPRTVNRVQARVTSSSRRFAHGSARVEVRGESLRPDGTGLAVEATVSPNAGDAPGSAAGSGVSVSFERPMGVAGAVGGRASYVSHPEIAEGAGAPGLRVMSISSAERFGIGDFAEVQAGSRIESVTGPNAVTITRPFLRVDVHPGTLWLLTYNLATAPEMQDYEAATTRDGEVPVLGYANGRTEAAGGVHQEISLAHKSKGTVVSIAYYADSMDHVALMGGFRRRGAGAEVASVAEMAGDADAAVDESSRTFAALGPGYDASGINLVLTQTLRQGTCVAFQYSTGSALGRPEGEISAQGSGAPQLDVRRAQAATASVRASVARTGTKARVSYRWQPGLLVTAVDPYDVSAGGEYLSFHVRQPLRVFRVVPEGLELTVDGDNLLRQGYRQFEGKGGVPLYLASSPQSFQAGLAFSF